MALKKNNIKKVKVRKTSLREADSSNFVTDLRFKKRAVVGIHGAVQGDNFLKTSKSSWDYFLHNQAPEAQSGRKSFIYFVLISVALIIFLKILVYTGFINLEKDLKTDLSTAGSLMYNASKSVQGGDMLSANSDFSEAADKFLSIEKELGNVDGLILSLAGASSNEKYRLFSQSKKISQAATISATLGQDLSAATDALLNDNEKSWEIKLKSFQEKGVLVDKDLSALEKSLNKINAKRLPADWRDKFSILKSELALWHNDFKRVLAVSSQMSDFLGYNKDRRYLLVFQNNTEMRASGGFIGSYAIVDFRNGQIKNIEVPKGGSYDTEGAMRKLIKSPAPLCLVSDRWFFWDANWFPDWPTTSRNLMWFYENSGGSSVDGVISFTPTVFEDLLKITGPIDMQADYGLTISAENFYDVVQSEVEKKATSTPGLNKEPKKIIGDLFAKTLELVPSLLNKETMPQFIRLMEQDWRSKQILVYLKDPSWQEKINSLAISGRMETNPGGDYLMVVNSNIAGQKTDRVMRQFITLKTEITKNQAILDHLTITREHQGKKGDQFTGVRNVNWIRVYTPRGTKLISANGFSEPEAKYFSTPDNSWENSPFMSEGEIKAIKDSATGLVIYDEGEYTVFAGWSMVDPGQNAIINLDYKLPQNFSDKYSLLAQKQPGDLYTNFAWDISGVEKAPLRAYPITLSDKPIQQIFDRDLYFYYLWPAKANIGLTFIDR